MSVTDWRDIFSVLVTPFSSDGSIDFAAFRANVVRASEDGASGVIVAGSTGEFYSLADSERLELFAAAADTSGGRIVVIGGCNKLGFAETTRLARDASRTGVDGLMLLPPLFVQPSRTEVIDFFAHVSDATSLPILVYNNPKRTGVFVDAELLDALASKAHVVAIKDSSQDMLHFARVMTELGDRIRVFQGFDNLTVASVALGAHGLVSMAHQVFGKLILRLLQSAQRGDWEEARHLEALITPFYRCMYSGVASPYAVVKAAMNEMGYTGGYPRKPFRSVDSDLGREVSSVLDIVRTADSELETVTT